MQDPDALIDCLLDIKMGRKTYADFLESLDLPIGTSSEPEKVRDMNHESPTYIEAINSAFDKDVLSDANWGGELFTRFFVALFKGIYLTPKKSQAAEILYDSFTKVELTSLLGVGIIEMGWTKSVKILNTEEYQVFLSLYMAHLQEINKGHVLAKQLILKANRDKINKHCHQLGYDPNTIIKIIDAFGGLSPFDFLTFSYIRYKGDLRNAALMEKITKEELQERLALESFVLYTLQNEKFK